MKFFDALSGNVTKAVDYVVEKNRKAALVNRIRIVIKNERESEARAYVALGKYYFENKRDSKNEVTEPFCRAVESSQQRMKKAFNKLDEITAPEGCDEDACTNCTDDCDYCPYGDDDEEIVETTGSAQINTDAEDIPPSLSIVQRANESADTAEEEAADDDTTNPEV